MSIWNKVLVGLICVASLALFYLAARTLRTHQYWCDLARQHEDKIDQVRNATGDSLRVHRKMPPKRNPGLGSSSTI